LLNWSHNSNIMKSCFLDFWTKLIDSLGLPGCGNMYKILTPIMKSNTECDCIGFKMAQ
jgi:hypothetical protein